MTEFIVVIPTRYASVRLPGKPLRDVNGRSMIEHVYRRGCESAAREVIIATDDDRIVSAAESFGATACMTGNQHRSGTERIAEVADLLNWGDDTIVVNLQGDEPTMPAELIDQCADLLDHSAADLSTLASPIASEADFNNPNVVKVILNERQEAIYFSRASIPYSRNADQRDSARQAALHHHGIYAYRCSVLRRIVAADPSPLEVAEQLEQLRALSLGMIILVGRPAIRPGPGVDTEEDLLTAARKLAK